MPPEAASPISLCYRSLGGRKEENGDEGSAPDRGCSALVPVCGGLLPPPKHPGLRVSTIPAGETDPYAYVASRLAALPVWLFHGEDDGSVPVTESRQLAAALEQAGAPVRYTEYPGVGHGSWDPAYAEPGLWEWLFAQRRTW